MPTAVVMDFQNSKETSMCYVALSRVQELSQVYIVDKLHEDCAGWRVNFSALEELEDSMKKAINIKVEEDNKLEIMCMNAQWSKAVCCLQPQITLLPVSRIKSQFNTYF